MQRLVEALLLHELFIHLFKQLAFNFEQFLSVMHVLTGDKEDTVWLCGINIHSTTQQSTSS